jgi:hypothetical protein
MVLMAASPSMIAAVDAVWRIPRPGPDNLLASPTFIALSELCQAEYGGGKPVFALSTALRSLGLPCHLPANKADLCLDPESAAKAIDDAYIQLNTGISTPLRPSNARWALQRAILR